MKTTPLIFEQGNPGRTGVDLRDSWFRPSVKEYFRGIPLRDDLNGFPEVTEMELVRHYTRLSEKNVGVDNVMYPLGSCTMKHNPRVNEAIAQMSGFANLHPKTSPRLAQGALAVLWKLERMLSEICGMDAFTLNPVAGAHGELTGLKLIRAALEARGEKRDKVLIPLSAHGTNPASAALAGFTTAVDVPAGQDGILLPEDVAKLVDENTACLMLTNPNTLGLFETYIAEIAKILHDKGAYLYCDGANLNALVGVARPGDMGVDVIQTNMHKTFSTPHGGGGPGAGPVGVKKEFIPFLPAPRVINRGTGENPEFDLDIPEKTIGRICTFFGNFLVLLRAYAYIRTMGEEGLRAVSENAVLNANYLRVKLSEKYNVPYKQLCMHEFVANDEKMHETGISTMDVAKSLIDRGFHPMTVYFPLCVHNAMLIEPTETETLEELDRFVDAMNAIADEAIASPTGLHEAPIKTSVRRIKDTEANLPKNLNLRWKQKT